ncbi:hypothetical protein M8998_03900 [Sphingobacterium sp. lm-10]|uniref:tetratricopeptide repeat protein n=1 Tax=Sphingobacterium sp. lm-10 TaxID=2944904 RepID=UPI002020C337|nr:hypothetical protein [Sphingobacterium sp. lm-10]MCL7987082.1 hypothetical protein [Sphingobacterium sp. lm-10]
MLNRLSASFIPAISCIVNKYDPCSANCKRLDANRKQEIEDYGLSLKFRLNIIEIAMSNVYGIAKSFWILCCLVLPLWTNAQDHLVEEKTSQAMIHYQDEEYARAAQLYEELLEKDYNNAYLLSQCGLCYYLQQEFQLAKEKFRLATLYANVDDKETLALYHSNLSAAYSNLDEDEQAFEHAVKAYYMDKERLWNAASMAQNIARYDDCLKLMNEADPTTLHNAFQTLYGRSYYQKQEYRTAIKHYKTFFDRYDPSDDTVPLIIKDDRNFYLYSCLYLLAQSTDEDEQGQIMQQIVDAQQAHPMVFYRQDMLAFFTAPKNICKTYQLRPELSKRLYRSWIKEANKYDDLLFSFYALDAFEETYALSTDYLKDDVGEIELEFRQIQFFSALQLYLQDAVKSEHKQDSGKIQELLRLFDGFFEADKTYSFEEFVAIPRVENLIEGLLLAFRSNYRHDEDKKRLAPIQMKFIERLPNPDLRDKIIDDLGMKQLLTENN